MNPGGGGGVRDYRARVKLPSGFRERFGLLAPDFEVAKPLTHPEDQGKRRHRGVGQSSSELKF